MDRKLPSDVRATFSAMLDMGATDARLEQLARLTAARYWKRPHDPEWGRAVTFMFRPDGEYLYAVFPIYRRNYHAVVRVARADVPPGEERLKQEDVDVRAVSVLESDALRIASQEVMEEP
jgi:hypothetical protein